MKPAFFSGLLMLVLGALTACAALLWLPHCMATPPMKCVWMTHAVAATAGAVAILGVITQFADRGVAMGLQIANVVLGLLIIALATVVIGPCPNPLMKCHTTTEGALVIAGAVLALVALADFWRLSRRR